MVSTFNYQRPSSFDRMARGGAEFTKTVMHAVIHHAFLFSLPEKRWRGVITRTGSHLFARQNPFAYPMVGRPTDANRWVISIEA